jgi:hypothetical protein
MPYDDELGDEQSAVDRQVFGWMDGEERNGAEADQEQGCKSGVVAEQQEFTMDLLHARVVVHLLLEAVPCGVFRFRGRQLLHNDQLGEPGLVDRRITMRVFAECAIAWKCMMPSQEDESRLHVRAEQAVSDGRVRAARYVG